LHGITCRQQAFPILARKQLDESVFVGSQSNSPVFNAFLPVTGASKGPRD
jgi:hypothetical protein